MTSSRPSRTTSRRTSARDAVLVLHTSSVRIGPARPCGPQVGCNEYLRAVSGQNSRAADSLTIATGDAPSRSPEVKSLPRTIGTRSVAKYRGPTTFPRLGRPRTTRLGRFLLTNGKPPPRVGNNLGTIPSKHEAKRSSRANQPARRVNKIDNLALSAKPPSPVQIRAAPPKSFEKPHHLPRCGTIFRA